MRLHGTVQHNMHAAVRSARRLRGQVVYNETIQHWSELLCHAKGDLAAGGVDRPSSMLPPVNQLVAELESELAGRSN